MFKKTVLLLQILAIVFMAIFLSQQVYAAELVTLSWDANEVTPDGYGLFVRDHANNLYGDDNPIWVGTETLATVEVESDRETAFIVRAFANVTALDGTVRVVWGPDSKEVIYTPKVTPDAPANLKEVVEQALRDISDALVSVADALEKEDG